MNTNTPERIELTKSQHVGCAYKLVWGNGKHWVTVIVGSSKTAYRKFPAIFAEAMTKQASCAVGNDLDAKILELGACIPDLFRRGETINTDKVVDRLLERHRQPAAVSDSIEQTAKGMYTRGEIPMASIEHVEREMQRRENARAAVSADVVELENNLLGFGAYDPTADERIKMRQVLQAYVDACRLEGAHNTEVMREALTLKPIDTVDPKKAATGEHWVIMDGTDASNPPLGYLVRSEIVGAALSPETVCGGDNHG